VRVGRVVCEVETLAEGAVVGESNVEAFLTLIDLFHIRIALPRAMKQKLYQLRWHLVRELLEILLKLVYEVELYSFVLELED